ncbi:ATP-binding protein [Corticicoccus populi]|uniref:ATP-binding protein n=1 Tax=Corticicoccus populi TaxID=1812821 RepID=A0ABW5WT99_9STAP
MKRLAVVTVGMTHSGKSSFAEKLESRLDNSFVLDQDNHAAFINTYYQKLQPKNGTNTLKHSITDLLTDYAIVNTDLHFITCSSNLVKKGRTYLLETFYNKELFTRILVYFDIPHDILKNRVKNSVRNTNIFRGDYTNFEQVLTRQINENYLTDAQPSAEEADYLFVVKNNDEVDSIIKEIIAIAEK